MKDSLVSNDSAMKMYKQTFVVVLAIFSTVDI